jgi:hypothetical protein
MKYAILSTDNNPDYYSLLPLVCHSWQKLGYQPVIIFANVPYNTWKIIMDACPDAKSHVIHAVEGVKDSTLAQLQRLFMGVHAAEQNDIMISADADMVIASDIFTHDVSQGQIVSYGYDLTGRSELPICYVKTTAAKWRELMGEFTIPEKAYSERWEDYWSVDQQLLTQRAHEYGMSRITFIDRGNQNKHGLPTSRWDRFDWAHIPDSIIDVHMKRNDWDAQIEVFQRLWPGEDYSFINKFREALEGQTKVDIVTGEDVRLKGTWQEFEETIGNTIDANYLLQELPKWDERGNNFLKAVTGNWNNHLPLIILGLQLSRRGATGFDVIELGSGEGSTPLLRQYCTDQQLTFQSFDNNKEWCEKTGAQYIDNWDLLIDEASTRHHGLIFIDHAPGERRHLDAIAVANAADVLVLHDTEEGGAGNYMWEKAWPHFKYRLNYNRTGGGAGATLVSNKIDVNRFRGLSLGPYTFDND